jgi:hypothetical protein
VSRKKAHWFEEWVSGNGLLNFTLSVWVFFLMHTYTRILWAMNQKANGVESGLHVIQSLGLGLVTFLIIRRAKRFWIKLLFAVYEFLAVFLYYNEKYNEWLTLYIALLCASAIFGLGYISTQAYNDAKAQEEKEEEEVNSEILRLTSLLENNQSELTDAQSLVFKSQSELTTKEQGVSELQNRVSELQNAVTILTNGVTERESKLQKELQVAYTQMEAQRVMFETYKQQATEWEREYNKQAEANKKRSESMRKNPSPMQEQNT